MREGYFGWRNLNQKAGWGWSFERCWGRNGAAKKKLWDCFVNSYGEEYDMTNTSYWYQNKNNKIRIMTNTGPRMLNL